MCKAKENCWFVDTLFNLFKFFEQYYVRILKTYSQNINVGFRKGCNAEQCLISKVGKLWDTVKGVIRVLLIDSQNLSVAFPMFFCKTTCISNRINIINTSIFPYCLKNKKRDLALITVHVQKFVRDSAMKFSWIFIF